jgi:hypothetical protein
LQLKGYDLILGYDWIHQHSPIGLDLRALSRKLTIQKNGTKEVVFSDFTAPPQNSFITVAQLEKIGRTDIVGYIIQINVMQQTESSPQVQQSIHDAVADILQEFAKVFTKVT